MNSSRSPLQGRDWNGIGTAMKRSALKPQGEGGSDLWKVSDILTVLVVLA